MGGKAILIVVLGFSLIFLIMEKNIGSASTRSVSNMADYHATVTAYNIAVSGANIAANQIYLNKSWKKGYKNISYQNGKINVTVDVLDTFRKIIRINSVGTFRGKKDTVQITLQPSKFSKFAYYSQNEGNNIWWTTGDTVWGPLHSQDVMNIDGSPVFMGKVTSKKALNLRRGATPKFLGGFEQGVNLKLPKNGVKDLKTAARNGGAYISGKKTVYIKFDGDNIKYKYSTQKKKKKRRRGGEDDDEGEHNDNKEGKWTTVPAKTFAPNGTIFVNNAILRISGKVKGQYTIGVGGKGSKGNIYIDDDIVYDKDPVKDPSSEDLLGIIAQNNVYVTDNSANSNGINIDAAIYVEKGGFGAENYRKRGPSGTINLLGGISQRIRRPVGTFNWRGVTSGFNKSYKYDNRLMFSFPPTFPNTGFYEIVSWYE